MNRVMLLVFEIAAVFSILYVSYRAWKKADIKDKIRKAGEIEQDHKTVTEFEKSHKDISKKNQTVNKFKKTDF